MVTLAGTVAAEVGLLDKVTINPPAGAGPLSVAVPVLAVPPRTLGGEAERLTRIGGLIVSGAVLVGPL